MNKNFNLTESWYNEQRVMCALQHMEVTGATEVKEALMRFFKKYEEENKEYFMENLFWECPYDNKVYNIYQLFLHEDSGLYVTKSGQVFDPVSETFRPMNNRGIHYNGKHWGVAKMIYETFVGPVPEHRYLYHKDKNPNNNSIENIALKG